jgi:tetratricopeptide (TPR) repeat protein
LELDPKCAPALNNLGSIQREHKDKQGAIDYYQQVLDIHPNYLESLNNIGAVLTEEERFEEALPHLVKATKLNPRYSEAHCNIGQTFLGLEQVDQAFIAFNRAIELKPDYAEAYMARARVFQERNRSDEALADALKAVELKPEKAEQAFDKALELKEDLGRAHNGKGSLYLQLGKLEEAEACHRHALSLDEDDLLARISLTLVNKTKEGDENMAALVAKEDELKEMPSTRAMSIHFALGKCYDDTGEIDKAFPHWLEGCRIKRGKIDYDEARNSEYVDNIITVFNEDTLKRLDGSGDPSDVPIFVLGMPRSGTTLTEQIIASHPDVYGGGELPDLLNIANRPQGTQNKANNYPLNLRALNAEDIGKLGTKYVTGVRERSDAKHITDKMPANFFCIGLIHLMLPNAKIIHVNRNPVDTCLSGFSRLFNHGQYHSYDLTELGQYYRNYARLMDHWRKVLPAGSFLDIQYEDLVADIDNQARRIIEYCGLPWNDACLEFHKTERSIRTASVTQVRQPVYQSSVQRWKRYEKHLQPLLEALGDLVPAEAS